MKTKYKNIIFDLDGTLSDSREGVLETMRAAFMKFGVTPPETEVLMTFIGPPTDETFGKYFSKDEAKEVVEYFRNYYTSSGAIFKNTMYDGFDVLLPKLKRGGYKLYIATTKSRVASERIMQTNGFAVHFDCICGVDRNRNIVDKTGVLYDLIESCNLDKDESILIGDTLYDAEGAANTGIDLGLVLYGFGKREILLQTPAEFYAETVSDIEKYFL